MPAKGLNILEPSEYIEIIEIIERERERHYSDPDFEGFANGNGRDITPKSLALLYGTTERNVVRALRAGVGHYERVLRRRAAAYSPALAECSTAISDAEFDFIMYELTYWLDDSGTYEEFFISPVVARRYPAIHHFRSLTHLRRAHKRWSRECQRQGVALTRAQAQARELRHEAQS